MGLKIIDNLDKFVTGYFKSADRALNRMAVDIDRLSKAQVPIGKHGGQLRASGYHSKIGFLLYRIVYNMEYARYQEFGEWSDGSHKIRKHTYPGKKTFYLRDAGNTIAQRATQYFVQEAGRIKI